MHRVEWYPAEPRDVGRWREAVPAGVRLTVVAPPYLEAKALPPHFMPARGDVMLVDLEDPAPERFPPLMAALRRLRRTHAVATALRVQLRWERPLPVIAGAHALGFDAVILEGDTLSEALAAFLAAPLDLPGEWLRWLEERRAVPGRLSDLVRGILTIGPEAASVGSLTARLETPDRTIRQLLRQHTLPKLERWYDGVRLLAADLQLQREPALSVEEMAQRLGYSDAYSYSSRAYRLFGITPAASRKLLGLGWRLDAWWRRSRRLSIHGGKELPPRVLLSSHD